MVINCMDKDDFALLKVMASNIETIKEELREMKDSIKSKVDLSALNDLKQEVAELKKDSKAIHNKWYFASGLATAASYLFSHLFK